VLAGSPGFWPGDTVTADAEGLGGDAIRVARAFDRDLPVTLVIEQPCATLENCVAFASTATCQ
jgi:hypothetical protein